MRMHGAGRRAPGLPAPGAAMLLLLAGWLAGLLVRSAGACDSDYTFPNLTESGEPVPASDPLVRLEATLQWQSFPHNGSVYLAMAFGVGREMERLGVPGRQCSSGYMGGQIHEDGSHHLLFSLWDYNATLKTAFGVKPLTTDDGKTGCSAFGGEGTGGHCGAPLAGDDFMWEVGTEYTFAAWMEEADAQFHGFQGVVWQAHVTNQRTGRITDIGQIFVRSDFLGGQASQCNQMTPGAYSFQEYFLGGNYYAAATWRGPAYYTAGGRRLIATDASPCCGMETHVWSPPGTAGGGILGRNVSRNETNRVCRPPDCDEVEVFFNCGVFPLDVYSPAAEICGIAECRPAETFCSRLCSPGHGSCANATSGYPATLKPVTIVKDRSACEAVCDYLGPSKCAAYSYCEQEACNRGACELYPPPVQQYTKCNGYPGNTCYVRPRLKTVDDDAASWKVNDTTATSATPAPPLPPVFDVFVSGEEGYTCYRIPVLLRLPDSNIALFAEGRKDNCDDISNTDIVFKVSKDGGRSFGPLRRLYGESTNTTKVTIGNPSPVVVGGKVLLLCVRNAQRLLRLRSSDSAGLLWPSKADDITDVTFAHLNTHMECGPGALRAGADMRTANLTVGAAKQWCLGNISCAGFTARVLQPNTSTPCAVLDWSPAVYEFYFKSRAGGNSDSSWLTWSKPNPPGTLLATGPPGGIVLPSSHRIVSEFYRMGGPDGSSAAVLLSDDGGQHFYVSATGIPHGGEGTIAPAPNGSLIMNTRSTANMRLQSDSRDGGEHWSQPRVLAGYGSNAEGAMIRMNSSEVLLFSHAGNVNGTGGRWNMTVWASRDSAATWTPTIQVEPDADVALHQAYSTLLQLSKTQALIVWERGPMRGSCKGYPGRCFQPAGEYQTLRARTIEV